MNNPYNQRAHHNEYQPQSYLSSPESVLRNLLQSARSHSPSLEAIDSILEQRGTAIKWTLELAQKLTTTIVMLYERIVEHQRRQQSGREDADHLDECFQAMLFLLVTSMESWSENVIYAVLIYEVKESKRVTNLLELLIHLTTTNASESTAVSCCALVGLSISYRTLDRLQQWTTLDPNRPAMDWWLDTDTATSLMPIIAQNITDSRQVQSFSERYSPTTEHVQLAAASILSVLLKRNQLGATLNALGTKGLLEVYQSLLQGAQTLTNPQLPLNVSKWFLPWALSSVASLSLLQWQYDGQLEDFDRIVQSTALVENIIRFAVPSDVSEIPPDIPRWVWDQEYTNDRSYALDAIYCWSLTGNDAWTIFESCEQEWRLCCLKFWTDASYQRLDELTNSITTFWTLFVCSRSSVRSVLHSLSNEDILQGDEDVVSVMGNMLKALFKLTQNSVFSVQVQAARIIWSLLSDRRSLSAHDDLSRTIWKCVDEILVKQSADLVFQCSTTEDTRQPLFLAAIDILDAMFLDMECRDLVLRTLEADKLEKLIHMIQPREIRYDYIAPDYLSLSQENTTDTPPANNLSRVDEKSICIEQEDEKAPKGIDATVRLATATALARLVHCASEACDEGIALLKGRVCISVNDFLANFHSEWLESESSCVLSRDLSKRSFRLQIVVATDDNEDFVATTLFSAQIRYSRNMAAVRKEHECTRAKLQAAEKRVKVLEEQNARYTQQSQSQNVVFEREISRVKVRTSEDAKQLVGIHALQRKNAEKKVAQYVCRLEEKEAELERVASQMEESQKAAELAREDLKQALGRATALEIDTQNVSRQLSQEIAKSGALQEELHNQKKELETTLRKSQSLETEVHEFNRMIENGKTENSRLRRDLEDLFSDMVSLVTIYEAKEKEAVSVQKSSDSALEAINSKLHYERDRNEELSAKTDQLRSENDKLYRKLAKYRERLEEERRERQEQAVKRKRNGPVSYINQLHNSVASESTYRNGSSRKEHGSLRIHSHEGKENSLRSSASSLRRKHY